MSSSVAVELQDRWSDSLDNRRRTANAGVGKIKPCICKNKFFLQQADLGEHRGGMAGSGCWTGAVRRHADRAGRGLGPVRVVVGRLCGDCPQHQGQAEPSRPSYPDTHSFPALGLDCLELITVIRNTATLDKLL